MVQEEKRKDDPSEGETNRGNFSKPEQNQTADCSADSTSLKVCLDVNINTAPTALKTKTSGVVYLVTIYASLTHGVLAGTQSTSSPAPPNHSAISRSADSTESLP